MKCSEEGCEQEAITEYPVPLCYDCSIKYSVEYGQ